MVCFQSRKGRPRLYRNCPKRTRQDIRHRRRICRLTWPLISIWGKAQGWWLTSWLCSQVLHAIYTTPNGPVSARCEERHLLSERHQPQKSHREDSSEEKPYRAKDWASLDRQNQLGFGYLCGSRFQNPAESPVWPRLKFYYTSLWHNIADPDSRPKGLGKRRISQMNLAPSNVTGNATSREFGNSSTPWYVSSVHKQTRQVRTKTSLISDFAPPVNQAGSNSLAILALSGN